MPDNLCQLGEVVLIVKIHDLVNAHRFGLAFDPDIIQFSYDKTIRQRFPGEIADDDPGTVVLVRALQACRQVHPIPDNGVVHPFDRPYIS